MLLLTKEPNLKKIIYVFVFSEGVERANENAWRSEDVSVICLLLDVITLLKCIFIVLNCARMHAHTLVHVHMRVCTLGKVHEDSRGVGAGITVSHHLMWAPCGPNH